MDSWAKIFRGSLQVTNSMSFETNRSRSFSSRSVSTGRGLQHSARLQSLWKPCTLHFKFFAGARIVSFWESWVQSPQLVYPNVKLLVRKMMIERNVTGVWIAFRLNAIDPDTVYLKRLARLLWKVTWKFPSWDARSSWTPLNFTNERYQIGGEGRGLPLSFWASVFNLLGTLAIALLYSRRGSIQETSPDLLQHPHNPSSHSSLTSYTLPHHTYTHISPRGNLFLWLFFLFVSPFLLTSE